MSNEKSGWEKYYLEKEKVDGKLLFSFEEMDGYIKTSKKTTLIFSIIISFLGGCVLILILMELFPSFFKI